MEKKFLFRRHAPPFSDKSKSYMQVSLVSHTSETFGMFHCFRHTISAELRNAGVSEEIANSITGHERAADNRLIISTPGVVNMYPALPSDSKKKELEVGDRMEDGTIFAGVSPDTGRNMFVTPEDASGVLSWKAAMKYAASLDANGHKDWKLPTKAELDVLYLNRDKGSLKGTFNTSRSSCYWSATEDPDHPDDVWVEWFSGGNRGWVWEGYDASVRPVRSEPRPQRQRRTFSPDRSFSAPRPPRPEAGQGAVLDPVSLTNDQKIAMAVRNQNLAA